MSVEEKVFVIDDEEDVREAVGLLIRSVGHDVQTFPTAQAFFDVVGPDHQGCLVLDVRMPGMNGMELQERLDKKGLKLPIVFISGHGDIPMAVKAVQRGAVDFLEKPFSDQELLDRVERALQRARDLREADAVCASVEQNLAALTPRETEVMEKLLEGKVNKIIARELDVSTRTVEIHRARVLQKMDVDNVSQLVGVVMEYRNRVGGNA